MFPPPIPDPDVIEARTKYPYGTYCGRCGSINDWADDCGWFHWHRDTRYPLLLGKNYVPVCRKCWDELGLTTCER